jgi:adenine-specific DNA-methyltransferase
MAKIEVKEQLKSLLRELFQLDNTDLDFGIYRILNLKSKEVEDFISVQLDAKVEEVKEKILQRQNFDIKAEFEAAKKELSDKFQVNFQIEGDIDIKANQYGQLALFKEPFNRLKDAKEKMDALKVSEDTEKSIYNELHRFFDRYYEGGDFISKPRAGKNNYLIPYEGEEVKLYWANHDQYYIKTGENFKNYVFTNQSHDPKTLIQVEFKVIDAEVSVNNNKEEKGRLFVPTENPVEWIVEESKLLVKFYYKVPNAEEKKLYGDKQSIKSDNKGINQRLLAIIAAKVKEINDKELLFFHTKTRTNTKGVIQPIFQYHLERYTTVNKFDYFIHKNLKEFLSRELDFFLKTEVLSIQFLNSEWSELEVQEAIKNNLLKASCIRELAIIIIEFVGELEDFQKRLYEKKKIVVQSDYCLTLDLISPKIYEEIINYILTDAERKQINEWLALNFISDVDLITNKKGRVKDKKSDILSDAKSFLKHHDKLLIDTQYLPANLKWKVLCSIEDIDNNANGLLINSDNWQALSLLMSKYSGRIHCNYIDPPYNSETSDFVYKNSYKHSSWLSMVVQNLRLSKKLLSKDGVINCAIDDFEVMNLGHAFNNVFGIENKLAHLVIEIKPSGRTRDEYLATSHEYVLIYAKDKEDIEVNFKELSDEKKAEYKFIDDVSAYKWRDFLRTGGYSTPEERPNSFYPIFYSTSDSKISLTETEGYIKIEPIDSDGKFRVWRKTPPSFIKHYKNGDIMVEKVNGNYKIRIKDRIKDGTRPKSVWIGASYDAASHGTKLLKKMFRESPFTFAKSLYAVQDTLALSTDSNSIILDQFAGSGTTGHAVIELNRNDDEEGKRKYILVEMGKYFDSATKARILKSAYSDKWKDGKPIGFGISHLFQYLKLEQYEDSLNNISFNEPNTQLSFLDTIRYQLRSGINGSDSLINLSKFSSPFNYTMKIIRQNEPISDTPIDLLTTFNFLLGIDIIRFKVENYSNCEYRIVFGKKLQQQYIIIWRNYVENELNLTAEQDWITHMGWYDKNAILFCNGDNAFSANPIEPEFLRLMTEPIN